MRRRISGHLRQNVVAYIALFFALGSGSAYASHLIVRSSDIVNNEVRSADVRDDNLRGGGLTSRDVRPNALTGSDVSALTGGDVNDNSLTSSDVTALTGGDVNDNSLTGADVSESSLGPVPNADRLNGKSASEIGVNGLTRVDNRSSLEASESPKTVTVSCPGGTVLLGSGYDIEGGKAGDSPDATANVVLDDLQQNDTAVSATAYEVQATGANWRVSVRATCAKAP